MPIYQLIAAAISTLTAHRAAFVLFSDGIWQPFLCLMLNNTNAMRTLSLKAPAAGRMAVNCGMPRSISATVSITMWRLRVLARWMIITTMAAQNEFYNFGRKGGAL